LAGPGSALLSYFVVGIFVYSVVISLRVSFCSKEIPLSSRLNGLLAHRGEMAAMYPVSGAFSVFGTRFVSPALGFTLGTELALNLTARSFAFGQQVGIIGFSGKSYWWNIRCQFSNFSDILFIEDCRSLSIREPSCGLTICTTDLTYIQQVN